MAKSQAPALLLNNELSNAGVALNDSQAVNAVVVHPLVLLSILDHHTRRQNGEGRVIGTLLGRRDGEKVCYSYVVIFGMQCSIPENRHGKSLLIFALLVVPS